jgi:hypothetical protein
MISHLTPLTLAFMMAFTASAFPAPNDLTQAYIYFYPLPSGGGTSNCTNGTDIGSYSLDISNWSDTICDQTSRNLGFSLYKPIGAFSVISEPDRQLICFVEGKNKNAGRSVISQPASDPGPGNCLVSGTEAFDSTTQVICSGLSDLSKDCPLT